ncbi:MAG: TonB-dependent receptor [Acidobacteria bacterium]|nr:TonB-dependent receptor [Acidobacteriota bacterium]
MGMRPFVRSAMVALLMLLAPVKGYGQVTTASVLGMAKDEQGAVIPGVTITAVHTETAAERSTVTDDQGRYRLSGLSLGNYAVRAELEGFKKEIRTGILLTLGREAVVDFTLSVGEITEQVVVSGEAPIVDTTSSGLGGLVNEARIKELPLNGRSFQQLALLEPGVVMATKSTGSLLNQGKGTRLSASGAKPYFNVFLLDSVELNDPADSSGASAAGQMLGVEGIREFRVMTSNFTAEYGRGAGAVVSAVTKSGTNTFHGSVYEFHRNSALDARNFFDVLKPAFRRHQFGAEVDGPIRRDSTFFMANYEALREALGRTLINFVPDDDARRGILPGRAPFQVNSAVAPYLALYPRPNGQLLGNGVGIFTYGATDTTTQHFFMGKVDQRLSNADSLSVRYRFDRAQVESVKDVIFDNLANSKSHNALVEEKRIFTPNLLNTVRFGYNRPLVREDGKPRLALDASLAPIPGSGMFWSSIDVTSLSSTGQRERQQLFDSTYQISDDAIYTRGAHSVKWGGLARLVDYARDTRIRVGGRWSFTSLFDFLNNRPNLLDTLRPPIDTVRNVRQDLFGFYVQDDIRARGGVTLNLGLRYEFITVPYEKNGKMNNLRDLFDTQVTPGKPLFKNPSLRTFAPRVGFAWDVLGDGKTALRGGFGMFHNQLTTRTWDIVFSNALGYRTQIRLNNPPFPVTSVSQLQQGATGAITVDAFQYDGVRTPYMMQWNLTVEKELFLKTVVSVGYVGSRGVNLPLKSGLNIPIPQIQADGRKFYAAGLPRRNPAFGVVTVSGTGSNSFYHSMRLSVNRRLAEGFQFQASYTFSKALDEFKDTREQGFTGSPTRPQDPYNRKADYGLSEIDVTHNFVTNWSYELPVGNGATGLAAYLTKAWRINGILTFADGAPFSVRVPFDRARSLEFDGLRPNLRTGASNNPILGRPHQYFDLTAFELQPVGYYGNLGRNTLRGPGLANVDFLINKDFDLGERVRIQFRTEFFNLLNRANFDGPGDSTNPVGIFDSAGQSVLTTARLSQTTTTARQIQFGLKVVF